MEAAHKRTATDMKATVTLIEGFRKLMQSKIPENHSNTTATLDISTTAKSSIYVLIVEVRRTAPGTPYIKPDISELDETLGIGADVGKNLL